MLKELEPSNGDRSGLVFDTTNFRKRWIAACNAVGLGKKIPVQGKPYDPKYVGLTLQISVGR